MELWQFRSVHCNPGEFWDFLLSQGGVQGSMRMSTESVITSWVCQSSESGDQVGIRTDTPLFEGVLNLCFLLSHVCIVTRVTG